MTLLFLHPIGLDGESWRLLDDGLLDGAIRYTMLWHGTRPRPADPPTIASFAADVAAGTSGQLDVIGLSLGGAVAQELALRHPERVRSLLLACSSSGGAPPSALLERASAAERDGMAGVAEGHLQRWFTPGELADRASAGVRYARERLLADEPGSFAASWRALAAHDTTARLHRIEVPTTVLHATEDSSGSAAARRELADRIPHSRFATVPGPHMAQLETPLTVGSAIRDHLRWVADA
jgi:3-oxoadipate enol-lactonase